MTPSWLIDRRTVLRGAGNVAIALPFLQAMQPPRKAYAAAPPRFVVFYTPGGTVIEAWRPQGTTTNYTFGSILQPLEGVKQHITVVDGVELKVAKEGFGHPHTRGMAGVLTGQPTNEGPYETCGGKAGFANGPSVDQVIANKISADRKFKSLQVAVRWPTFFYGGARVSPTNVLCYEGANRPLPPETDPRALWDRLFKDLGTTGSNVSADKARRTSILDTVKGSYTRLSQKVGTEDRAKLDAHLAKIREVEMSLAAVTGMASAACSSKFGGDLDGAFTSAAKEDTCDGCVEAPKDTLIPRTGKILMDLVAMALACDLTRVATVQWMDSASNNSFPWLGLTDTHHGYQHDRGYQPDGIVKIDNWYAQQFRYFVDKLLELKEGDTSLLASTGVFWCKEISHPNAHSHTDMPFVLAGNAGGAWKGGGWRKVPGASGNDLLLGFVNAYGIDAKTFGKPAYCTGPLAV